MGFVPRRGLFRSRRRVPGGRGGDHSRAGWLELPPRVERGFKHRDRRGGPLAPPRNRLPPRLRLRSQGDSFQCYPQRICERLPRAGQRARPRAHTALPPRPSGWPWKQVRERAAVRTAAGHAATPGPARPGRLSWGPATPGPGCGCPREEAAEAGAVGGFPTRPDALGARSRTPTLPPGHGRRVKRCSACWAARGRAGKELVPNSRTIGRISRRCSASASES